jgi:hypothetical protein
MLHLRFALFMGGIAVGLFLAMLLFIDFGWRLGLRQARKRGADSRAGVGVVDSAVYAVLALLIGFTFSGATARYDQRRLLIADEVNVTGTAWQRVDMLPADQQPPVRDAMRTYVDALIAWYAEVPGATDRLNEPATVTSAARDLWTRSVAACLTPTGEKARMLLLPSLNDVFGAVEKERMARRIHPPLVIFVMLGIAILAASLFAGYGLASSMKRNWMYVIGVSATIAIAVYVILELEYPRLGVFRVNAMDQTLVELRATMK